MENNYQQPLEVEVAVQGSSESPNPTSGSPSPVFEVPEGDASIFMGPYSLDDLADLEEWARRVPGTQRDGRFCDGEARNIR